MTDLYGRAGGGNWGDASTWSLSSGGGADGSVPIATDNVFLDANSGNIVANVSATCANFVCTGYTGTLSGSSALAHTGDTFLLVAGMTYTYTGSITFTGANAVGDVTLTRAGKTTNQSYTFNGVGGVFNLADTHNLGTGTITLTNGTFDSMGFDITCGGFQSGNTNTRTLTLTGSDVFITATFNVPGAGLTFAAPDILKITRGSTSPTNAIVAGNSGDTYNVIQISRNVTAAFSGFQFTGAISVGELAIVDVPSSNFLACVMTVPNDLTIDKCSFPEGSSLVSTASGTQRTITTNTNEISFDGCMIRDIVISGGPAIATGSIDLGNNSGITFQNFGPATHEIVGVTYDDAGAALPSCLVVAFKEDAGVLKEVSRTTSDGTTGAYTLPTPDAAAAGYTILATKTSANRGDAMVGITPTVP